MPTYPRCRAGAAAGGEVTRRRAMAQTAGRRPSTRTSAAIGLPCLALAGVLSAVSARLLSRDLMSPGWAVIGVVLLTSGVVWCTSWRSDRRVDPALTVVSLVLCGAVAWAAWVPASLVL